MTKSFWSVSYVFIFRITRDPGRPSGGKWRMVEWSLSSCMIQRALSTTLAHFLLYLR